MRFAISVLASLLAIAPLSAVSAQQELRLTRIRPMQKDGARLLSAGIAQSATFRRLVERLERSNVIVYVELRPDMPANRGGTLRFLARSSTDSFLRIQMNRVFTGRTLIALLGHELQHAVEVAEAGGVGSVAELRALYERLGERRGADQFDTFAARHVGYIVREELAHHGAEPTLAMAHDQALPEMEDLDQPSGTASSRAGSAVPVAGSIVSPSEAELVRQ